VSAAFVTGGAIFSTAGVPSEGPSESVSFLTTSQPESGDSGDWLKPVYGMVEAHGGV